MRTDILKNMGSPIQTVEKKLASITANQFTINLGVKMAERIQKSPGRSAPSPTVDSAMLLMGTNSRGSTHTALKVIREARVFIELPKNNKIYLQLPNDQDGAEIDVVVPAAGALDEDEKFRRLEDLALQNLSSLNKVLSILPLSTH